MLFVNIFLMTNIMSYLRHFYNIASFFAGVPCFALHRLPGDCRHYVTFFLKIFLRFCVFEILCFLKKLVVFFITFVKY